MIPTGAKIVASYVGKKGMDSILALVSTANQIKMRICWTETNKGLIMLEAEDDVDPHSNIKIPNYACEDGATTKFKVIKIVLPSEAFYLDFRRTYGDKDRVLQKDVIRYVTQLAGGYNFSADVFECGEFVSANTSESPVLYVGGFAGSRSRRLKIYGVEYRGDTVWKK